jgi:predicted double-glycine peptidase
MTASENPSTRRFLWPAEYYSGPLRPPVLPQWAPFGCGAAAVVVLILVFAGGAFLSSGGFLDFMDFAVGMSASEMKGQYAAEVTAAQRKALDDEVVLLRKNLREEKISVVDMQPFLESLRNASGDRKITVPETESLQAIVRRINARAKM